jgi:hypothetical protein
MDALLGQQTIVEWSSHHCWEVAASSSNIGAIDW